MAAAGALDYSSRVLDCQIRQILTVACRPSMRTGAGLEHHHRITFPFDHGARCWTKKVVFYLSTPWHLLTEILLSTRRLTQSFCQLGA
ncbi:hypothetical protein BDW69DRAFT_60447 [Aspergillus filifer]